jgi:hypothetical protein
VLRVLVLGELDVCSLDVAVNDTEADEENGTRNMGERLLLYRRGGQRSGGLKEALSMADLFRAVAKASDTTALVRDAPPQSDPIRR